MQTAPDKYQHLCVQLDQGQKDTQFKCTTDGATRWWGKFPTDLYVKKFPACEAEFYCKTKKNGALIRTIYKAHTCNSLCNKDSI